MTKNTKKLYKKHYNIALWGSGNGTLLTPIYNYAKYSNKFSVKIVTSNNKNANILRKAKKLNIKTAIYSPKNVEKILKLHLQHEIKLIILIGFIKKIPEKIFNKIKTINIHPTLIPNLSGKGMYGLTPHKKILENKLQFTGITIHYVNNEYDKGKIIYQKCIAINNANSPELLKKYVNNYEKQKLPIIIDYILSNPNPSRPLER